MADDVTKRMNYFDRQFLRASDFQVEQAYFVDRHRRHNRLLHSPGVAEGLLVSGSAGSSTITVAQGTAIDALGREIVLLAATPLTPLPGPLVTKIEVYIAYNQSGTDPSNDPGILGNTRITENPGFLLRRVLPTPDPLPGDGVLLAEVTLDGSGRVAGGANNPNNNVRTPAGAISSVISPDQGGSLELGDRFKPLSPYIDFHHGGGAGEDFDMRIINSGKGQLVIAGGNLGIAADAPGARLTVQQGSTNAGAIANGKGLFVSAVMGGGGAADGGIEFRHDNLTQGIGFGFNTIYATGSNVNQDLTVQARGTGSLFLNPSQGNVGIGLNTPPKARLQVNGAIMPAAGNTPQAGLQFPSDPGGGSSDEAFIRYFQLVGETTKLMIGVANEADDTIGFFQFGAERMTIFNGNIGIGTTSPVSDLHIRKDVTSAVGPILTLMNGAGGTGAGGAIDFDGYDPATKTPPGNFPTARIQSLDDGNFSSHLAFLTKPSGANDNALVERLRITNDGALRSPKWNVTQLASSIAGPLPLVRLFTTGGGTLMIFASGSGFGVGAIGMEILVDGTPRGQVLGFTNEPGSHKAFVANALVLAGVPAGLHNLTLRVLLGTSTATDVNDRFSVTVLELPF